MKKSWRNWFVKLISCFIFCWTFYNTFILTNGVIYIMSFFQSTLYMAIIFQLPSNYFGLSLFMSTIENKNILQIKVNKRRKCLLKLFHCFRHITPFLLLLLLFLSLSMWIRAFPRAFAYFEQVSIFSVSDGYGSWFT